MGDARFNPQAVAKAQGKQMVQLIDLGDGIGFAGFEIGPVTPQPGPCTCAAEGQLEASRCTAHDPPAIAAGLFGIGGRVSTLSVNIELRKVFIGELRRIPVELLKRLLSAEAPAEQPEEVAAQ